MGKTEELEIGFSFCDEIEEEIMLRLPTKSVSRFNCVSKTWYTRITNSEFAHKHLKHKHQTQSNNFNLMLHGNRGPLQSVSCSNNDAKTIKHHDQPLLVDFINHEIHRFNVLGSCYGLLLVIVTAFEFRRAIYIWNPTTGEYKTLPRQRFYKKSCIVYGFGPDLTTTDNNNHYKVLLLETFHRKTELEFTVNMYTTHTNSWKTLLPNAPFSYAYPLSQGMILAYDNLHYMAEIVTTDSPFDESIVSFDLKDDKFRVLPMVPGITILINLCALNGDLCAFTHTDDDCNFYGLWRMENFGVMKEECWTEIYSIDRRLAMDKPITFISPLHVLEDGQILLYAELKYPRQDDKPFIVSYNTENKKASFLVQDNVPFWCTIPVVYQDSFISPNAASTAEEELP